MSPAHIDHLFHNRGVAARALKQEIDLIGSSDGFQSALKRGDIAGIHHRPRMAKPQQVSHCAILRAILTGEQIVYLFQ
jgi:predicted metal-dependent phosphoesterase TrpH